MILYPYAWGGSYPACRKVLVQAGYRGLRCNSQQEPECYQIDPGKNSFQLASMNSGPRKRRPTAAPSRCPWAVGDEYIRYHDREWGVPVHDDRLLFEFLILEGAQAGLSWSTILKKRDTYRQAFDNFEPAVVAAYDKRKQQALLKNPGIVRNRLKIASAITNARAFLAVQAECGTFDAYIWSFVDGRPRQNAWGSLKRVPARTLQSDAMSKDLLRRGFRFVGSTICYAFMQAVGMVNDHLVGCFRNVELQPRTSRQGGRA
jgi:DNA-3-methyladenine glycosylase I